MCLRRHADACHFICICIYFLYFLYCRPCGQARAWADMLTLVIASARHSQKKMGQPAIYRSGLVLYLYSVFCICIFLLFCAGLYCSGQLPCAGARARPLLPPLVGKTRLRPHVWISPKKLGRLLEIGRCVAPRSARFSSTTTTACFSGCGRSEFCVRLWMDVAVGWWWVPTVGRMVGVGGGLWELPGNSSHGPTSGLQTE